MNRKLSCLLAVSLMSCLPAAGLAQDFSADVVYVAPAAKSAAPAGKTAESPRPPSKLYVTKNKMRLDTRGIMGTVLLVNSQDKTTIALFPDQKSYQPLASTPSEYFAVQDAENACADWQSASLLKISCEKVGHEAVDGRDTVKYQNKGATLAAPLSAVWIDPTLNFVVKWQGRDAAAELRNITKEEKLSPALFEIPQGFGLVKPKKKAPKPGAK